MLKEKLDKYSSKSKANTPDEAKATMENDLKKLQETHVENNVIKIGDSLPDFNLIDSQGNKYSKDSFKDKKLVLNFFRGSW